MSDFNNATLGGAEVYVDDVAIGYTDGDIDFGRSTEIKKLRDSIPLTTVGQVILSEEFTVKVPAVEITAANIVRAGLNLQNTATPGTLVTVSDGSNQEKTFASLTAHSNGVLESIVLDGPNVASLVVENTAENTTFTVNDDYILDAALGVVYRNPGGAISSGATVRVSYTWTPAAYDTIPLGVNNAIQNKKVKLVHISPVSGRTITVELWKCLGSGALTMSFKKEDWMHLDMEFTALPSSDHPTNPIGYIKIEAAA